MTKITGVVWPKKYFACFYVFRASWFMVFDAVLRGSKVGNSIVLCELRRSRAADDVTCTSKMTLLRAIIYIISVLSFACQPIDFMSVASPICVGKSNHSVHGGVIL
jgi:hypothetical protein